MLNIPLFLHTSVSPAHFTVNAKPARLSQGSYGSAGLTIDWTRLAAWLLVVSVSGGFWIGLALLIRWIVWR